MTYYHHAIVDSPHIARDLDSQSAQSVIITVMAELWPNHPPAVVPSTAVVDILGTIGVTETATRAALSRMQRRGTLQLERLGRRTAYAIAPDVAADIPRSQFLTMGFGGDEGVPWSGDWTIVIFSLPESERNRRQVLRDRLRWLGFGPVRDGVWLSPRCEVEVGTRLLADVLPEGGLILRSREFAGSVDVESAWPLRSIQEAYQHFVQDFRPYIFQLRAGAVSQVDALRLWSSALGRWRAFPAVDPDLPRSAMPDDWPQAEARRIFIAVNDACAPLVQTLVSAIVGKYDENLAMRVRALTVAAALDEYRSHARLPAAEDMLRVVGGLKASA